jgi:8-amino-7-oxononanoate synthase
MNASSFPAWLAAQAADRASRGLTRQLAHSDTEGLLDLAGNDYLGLARDPRVVAGAVAAARAYGVGAGASRLVSGTLSIHTELEREMAAFTGFPAALAFSSGYHANLSVVQALAGADTLIVSDAHIHASMIDACRLTRATVTVTAHNDVAAVARALAGRAQPRALVLAETIYSVLGDAAPLAELAEAAAASDAVLIADEAHALGVGGPGGRGLLAAHGLAGRPDVIATGTLSKSFGSQGGLVLSSAEVRHHLVNRARPFIYDTGLAPPAAGGALAAVRILEAAPELAVAVRRNAALLAGAVGVAAPAGAVLSVPMPGPREALAGVAAAAEHGVRIGCFRPPSTPDGISRLRLTARAQHSDEDLSWAAKVLRLAVAARLQFAHHDVQGHGGIRPAARGAGFDRVPESTHQAGELVRLARALSRLQQRPGEPPLRRLVEMRDHRTRDHTAGLPLVQHPDGDRVRPGRPQAGVGARPQVDHQLVAGIGGHRRAQRLAPDR